MAGWTSKAASFSAGVAIAILASSGTLEPLTSLTIGSLDSLTAPLQSLWSRATPAATPETNSTIPFVCLPQPYTTTIVSTDPLVIYIQDFLSTPEITSLLNSSSGLFKPSLTTKHGRTQRDPNRTSYSAGLPVDDPAVQCVLERARRFMGTMLAEGRDEMGSPQLVRYAKGQKFDLHYDWYPRGQVAPGGRGRTWNRPASFFAVLDGECTEGETWFPHISAVSEQRPKVQDKGEQDGEGGVGEEGEEGGKEENVALWREHEDGGIAFKPVAGNALFWVNLFANGTGDARTRHAGLPLGEGSKTAMNIWPKQYSGPGAWDPVESSE